MNTTANFSIWFGQASELKVDTPDRSQILQRMICPKILLAGLTVMLVCLARSAEPLKIGMVATLTGPAAEYGRYETQGAKLAAEEVNEAGGVLGRPIELVIEDSQSTNPGTVLAFSKLAG
ncbi:MAG: branched-chain amino acid transport system substrate-binding protein, partial [Acidobacteriaceae bacterium]|nr:branched-chain amino acid transport system substrate-binding protein [Acidobacteriaceae bacterium]